MYYLLIINLLLCFSAVCFGKNPPTARELLKDLACASCHSGISVESDIAEKAPDLTQAGIRYNPEYILNYLLYPVRVRQYIGLSRMPNFNLSQAEALALTLYLQELVPKEIEMPEFPVSKTYEQIRASNPQVDAQLGERIFYSLNCVACHKQSTISPWEKKMAPDLKLEGIRVKKEWLLTYLKKPTPVRPFGFYAGSGARMPDFLLTDSEAGILAEYLLEQKADFRPDSLTIELKELSAYNMVKAEKLLREKLSCLGCHQLGGEGGKIGPDLSSLNTRLQKDYVYQIINNPKKLIPEAVMPKIEMPQKNLELIVNYLLQQKLPRSETPYLSLVENKSFFHQGKAKTEGLYLKYCASCHGTKGTGDGFNAQYLSTVPTRHADASYMITRPDDTLFDGIHAGGYILNKSQQMPPWGATLEYEEIRELVAYIRELCQCQGPDWSRDN